MSALHRYGAVCALVTFAAVQAPAQAAPPPTSILTAGCEEQELSGLYPAEVFQKILPPGFKLATFDPAGLIAAVDMSVDRCSSVDGGPGSADFTAFVEVTPPAQYQVPGVEAYGLMLSLWSTRQQTVDALNAWGFGKQAALVQVDFKTGLDLFGNSLGSVTVHNGGHKVIGTTLFGGQATVYPAGTTRAFAVDASGALRIIEATWTDQTFQYGLGTYTQQGVLPLPLPLPLQVSPVIAGHASGYNLTLRTVQ